MVKRENHYEAAFEAYLRQQRLPYVAVDEAKRSRLSDRSLKSLDFIVSRERVIGSQVAGEDLPVELADRSRDDDFLPRGFESHDFIKDDIAGGSGPGGLADRWGVVEEREAAVAAPPAAALGRPSQTHGTISWLIDVKGRRFPSGGRQRQYWKNWSTRDDLISLHRWQNIFGHSSRALFVFAYNIWGDRSPLPAEQLFSFRGGLYGFVGIELADYVRWARPISQAWGTLAMPSHAFRQLAAPLERFFLTGQPACESSCQMTSARPTP